MKVPGSQGVQEEAPAPPPKGKDSERGRPELLDPVSARPNSPEMNAFCPGASYLMDEFMRGTLPKGLQRASDL